MGLFSSRPETPTMPPFVEHHSSPIMSHQQQPYPDMNVIFRSIPKMMQVADDMHRMTNYLEASRIGAQVGRYQSLWFQDMRNMCFALSAISALGVLAFLLLKCVKKQKHRRRRFINHVDSEQSSISRNGIGVGMGGGGGGYRHFARHVPNNGDWSHKIVDMENGAGGVGGGLGPSGQTTSTNTATTGTVHGGHSRHTPPIHNRYGVAHNAAVHSQTPVHMHHHVAPQDLQSSSLHSAISGNFINGGGNGGGGPAALGMKVGGGSAGGANKTPTSANKSE